MSGFNERIEKIRKLAREKGLETIVLRLNPNLAWAVAGRVHVAMTLDQACFDLVIDEHSVTAVVDAIEAPRLLAEEFLTGVSVEIVEWWEDREPKLPTGQKTGSDKPGGNRVDLASDLEQLRRSLVAEDAERLRKIGSQAAVAMGQAMREISADDREIDVAGRITKSLWSADLDIVYIGVGGESRLPLFKHVLPTAAPIGNRVVASICARRKGLIVSITRIATFGELSEQHYSEYLSILEVEAAMFDATKVGAPFSQAIHAAISAYPVNGFAENEWTKHHQGGPTGYLPRDWTAHRGSSRLIAVNQAVAWNPTGKGWKVEDTLITHEAGVELITNDKSWPALTVAGRSRPDILRR